MRRWWWTLSLLLSLMTGCQCPRWKKMMGRGADGGCGTVERPCSVSRVPSKIPVIQLEVPDKQTLADIDFYSQARKALCERSPFDVSDDNSALSSPTLPRGLVSFLSRSSDSRRRHKKSHSGADKKSSRPTRGSNIWFETGEYFRHLTLHDIDSLFELSSSFSSLAIRECILIPFLENDCRKNVGSCGNENVNVHVENGDENVVVKEEVKNERGQSIEIGSVGADASPQDGKGSSVSHLFGGLEWLLGTKDKVSLTSERPSKKRKLLGVDAGLEKVLVAHPCEGNSSLCHFCCMGDTCKESNRLVVCSSCEVAVHQKCYGVQEDVGATWSCAWCKKSDCSGNDSSKTCVLCPKRGGAIKPVHKSDGSGESIEFAHLFCCHWMPEVYIDDLTKMEPIMNVGAIKEARRKLVCNICKVKHGACVRCSHGTCRTSFHPICAREAGFRMEVWGKYGCDNVELRAFCSKHSDVLESRISSHTGDLSLAVGGDSNVANHLPVAVAMNKSPKLMIDGRNGDDNAAHMGTPDTISDKSGVSEVQQIECSNFGVNAKIMSECGDQQQPINVGELEWSSEDVNLYASLDVALLLKKLIDQGKINVQDVAKEIGISPDLLTATLSDAGMVPGLQSKILKWLRNHTLISTLQKKLKLKANSTISCEDEVGTAVESVALMVSESDIPDPVAVKSVPPQRRTKSNIRISKDNKLISSSDDILSDNGMVMDRIKVDPICSREADNSSKSSISNVAVKESNDADEAEDSLVRHLHKCEGNAARPSNCNLPERVQLEEVASPAENAPVNGEHGNSVCSAVNSVVSEIMKTEAVSSFYIHPYISKKLLQMELGILLKNPLSNFDGSRESELSWLEASSNASVCCNHQNQELKCNNMICKSDGLNLDQSIKAMKMGVLDSSPEDEVEGEIIYFQHRLLGNAVARRQFTDNLICNIVKSLQQEIDMVRRQRWDSVLVNQYLGDLREAKKQGRKERKHKEAQAVLAAATAAAAASSRMPSFRKDTYDDPAQQESSVSLNNSGRSGISAQLMHRKDTLSRLAAPRISLEKQADFVNSTADLSKEHPRSCDVCRRSDTLLNPILVCSSCKVAVHLSCYRSVKESTGPWCCELCEELLSSRSYGAPIVNVWEKHFFVVECGLCHGTTGAFRKSLNGEWVHAFCAEWVFESTFRRGQVSHVEGMDKILKEIDVCYICRRKLGVCIKCNYGHCQATFHPTCARSTGLYMNIKNLGGKLQHKAYCEKHSLEQRAKAETQEHGIEEFKRIKQIRVELERLRLICERIIRREKKKRELVLSSHDILACKRDHVARCLFVHGPFFLPEVSSESATTSLKGHTDGYKSCSDAIQRSDDVTVDSTVSVKHRDKVHVSMDSDLRTDDDSSTSQIFLTRKLTERAPFSGKQIPHRPSVASHNLSDDGGWRSKSRKHAETFEKELIMTSDQATMKNMRLPKGYQYVPADILPTGEQINQDASLGEPVDRHG